MKAIRIEAYGDNQVLQLQDVSIPTPNPDQVLVRLKAAGLNFIDIYMRTGVPRVNVPVPFTPGLEGAGIIEAVGEAVKDFKPGDRVAYTGQLGSYAEYNVVPANILIPLPDDLSFAQGAAFPLQGMTAQYLLHEYYPIQPGTNVLVHAAAGGVGLLLVQWLKKMQAISFGTISTEEKAQIAKSAGLNHAIFYTQQNFATEALRLTHEKGVDYIIDGVGKTTFNQDLEAIRPHGWICIYGQASGPVDPYPPNLLQLKSIILSGGHLRTFTRTREEILKRANDVLAGIKAGWLKLKIDHGLPLAEAAQAQHLLESRQTIGKVILTMD